MNNEPVAWRKSETDSEGQYFVYREEEPRWLEGYIPLYTHPAKTINNQKMIEVLMELAKYRLLTADEIEELAILRKAQENG